ncbi:Protein argonaute 5 [Leucoagaricus sp. SymC.cos]|nr:Protein argonaute 5 [Leucoagaricus sp. SymC.cos]
MSHRGQGQQRGGAPRGGGPPRGRGGPPGQGGRGGSAGGGSDGSGGRGRGSSFRGGSGGQRGGYGDGPRGGPIGPIIFRENTPARIPDRLADSKLTALISSFSSLRLSGNTASVAPDPARPSRPGFGTAGRAITLRANFFALRISKSVQYYYDYAVSISGPKSDKDGIKIRLFELLEQHPSFRGFAGHVAHDKSQRLVSSKELPQPLTVTIKHYDEPQTSPGPNADEYVVEIQLQRKLATADLTKYTDASLDARSYDLTPLLSALNLITQKPANKSGKRVGRTFPKYFYDLPTKPAPLSGMLEAWQGFAMSVRPTYGQLMVNVNVCMSAFLTPGNLADILFSFNRNSQGAMPTLPEKMIKSIKVRTSHLGHKKKLSQIMTTSARNTYFEKDKKRINVENYFKTTYNIQLKYPAELPVLNLGTKQKPILVPAELCDIEPGCAYRGRLSDFETSAMIKVACRRPRENADAIVDIGFPSLDLSPKPIQQQAQWKSPLAPFGIEVDKEMAVIPARELPPPSLNYRGGKGIRANNGSWNILEVKFHRAAMINSWCVLVVRDGRDMIKGGNDPNLMSLVQGFANKLKNCGMTLPQGPPPIKPIALVPPYRDDASRSQSVQALREVLATAGQPSFMLVLLEARDNAIYPAIKKIGDSERGIPTLCMQLPKALGDQKKQDQYFSNVALKLNTKLGGVNHQLEDDAMRWLKKKATMMVGIDVTHAGPTSRSGTPSIAAVVANTDDSFAQFPASLRIQKVLDNKESKEMVTDLKEMFIERLLLYEKKNRKLPERIFIFRDGVSEGQFDVVLREELPLVQAAFKKMETAQRKKYRPALSIVICGKRHHARFFPTDSQFADKNGNTRPGTVVDKGVTAVFDFDFYLQAHAGLQGTVKATHYTVIYDENTFGADEIQKGTHDFSYLYARATKAVSLIPPAYYADLACERGRCYLNDLLVWEGSTSGSVKGGKKRSKEEEREAVFQEAAAAWGNGLHPNIKDTMFYI